MAEVKDYGKDVPETVYSTLSRHLPHSLPLLRRLQFMNVRGGKTSDSHVLMSLPSSEALTVAYLDFSRGPETELWLYSSVERDHTSEIEPKCEEQIISILRLVAHIENEFTVRRETPGIVLIGTLHEKVLQILHKNQRVKEATTPYFKFLFESGTIPDSLPLSSEECLEWSKVNKSDIPLVLLRTDVPRKERTIILLPSAAVRKNGDMIAWGFLGPDGSLTSLHCEEGYRGRGLAKAVAAKLFQERTTDFGPEKIYHADVATQNLQSQGVCKSLGGIQAWTVYWAWIDLKGL